MAHDTGVRPEVSTVPLGADRRDDLLAVDQWAFAMDETSVDAETALLGLGW